jgi:hypothetical protein
LHEKRLGIYEAQHGHFTLSKMYLANIFEAGVDLAKLLGSFVK